MTKQDIQNWLSAHRKWSAWGKWIATQGDPISTRTLRRGLQESDPTPRQMKAIEAAKVYIQSHLAKYSFQKDTSAAVTA